jgi:hypothetical protein
MSGLRLRWQDRGLHDFGPDLEWPFRGRKGLDPNVWINNVEFMAAARVGQETFNYVSNIYKYYVAYKLIAVQEAQSQKALKEATQKK